MFTGIIENTGTVKAITSKTNLIHLTIDLGKMAKEVKLGDSVAINGACLTATKKNKNNVVFDLMRETLEKTSLRELSPSSTVNIELALQPKSRLGGHFVTGHVDELSTIKKIVNEKNWIAITFSVSPMNQKYIVPKGCITLDGVSLTVGAVRKGSFDVYLIPFTLTRSHFGKLRVGSKINLETDILAKYVKSL